MRWWVYFLLLLFLHQSAEAARRKTEWALHLDTKFEYTLFPLEYGPTTNQEFFKSELNPNYTWKHGEKWRLYIRPQFIADPSNNSESERYYFDLTEAHLRYKTETFTITLGNNLFNWGVTDGFNPIDVINSRQYFDPLHSKKQGATSLVWSQNFETWDYELIYIPLNKESTLPGENSRWLPREIFIPEPNIDGQSTTIRLPQNMFFRYGRRHTLDDALHNNFAARVQWRTSVDLGFSFYDGLASFPIIRPFVTGTVAQLPPNAVLDADPDVTLNTQNYRVRQGGVTLVANFWETLFKYAGSYSQSVGEDSYFPGLTNSGSFLPGWSQENILAVERTFNFGSDGMLIAVLQHSFINSEKTTDSNLSVTEIFRNAWMLGGRLSWGEVWSASLLGLYNTKHSSHLQEITLGRRLFDAWNVSVGVVNIEGSSEAPLGVYNKNDSYSLSVSRSF